MKIVEIVGYDNIYSFVYSPRPGTKAAQMAEMLNAEEKLNRLKILLTKQEKITSENLYRWLGEEVEVLIDGPSSSDPLILQGRLSQNITLNFDRHYPRLSPGELVRTRVTGAARFTLKGEFIDIM